MSNQTLNKPTATKRGRSKTTARAQTYRRQTAHPVEGIRDGKPLIFGWGAHLSKNQKQRIQKRAAYSFFAVVLVAILAVFTFGVVQQNFIIPNQTIVSINSTNITQDTYRKYLAYVSQDLWNTIQRDLKQKTALDTKVKNGDKEASTQSNILVTQLQSEESGYSQSQLTQTAMDNLVENQLILAGIKQIEKTDPAAKPKLEPTTQAIQQRLDAFKKAFPANESYADFLSKDNLSDSDVRAAVTIALLRDNLQQYLSDHLVSPTRQAHYRKIQVSTADAAANVLSQLTKGTDTWDQLAKQDSLDTDSKNVGGDAGWLAPGTGDAAIEDWIFAPNRQVNVLSPVIKDASGTFDVVEVLAFDPSRPVDASLLSAAKTNALTHWLSGRRADPANKISTPNSDMMTAGRNMPTLPDLNATLPSLTPPNGLPSQGGLPGGGILPTGP